MALSQVGDGFDHRLLPSNAFKPTAQQLGAQWLIPMRYRANDEPSAVESDDSEAFSWERGVADEASQPHICPRVIRNNLS